MKNKMLLFLSQINIPAIMFLLIVGRVLVYGAGFGDAIALLGVSGVYAYHKFLYRKTEITNSNFEKKLGKLEKDIESVNHKVNGRVLYEQTQKQNVRKF